MNGVVRHDYGYEFYFDDYVCVDSINKVKPYLLPLDSMTDEQKEEWKSLVIQEAFGKSDEELTVHDFYNMNYIDCRGLIPMGLAKDATNLDIY